MTDIEQKAIKALRDVRMPKETWHGLRAEALNLLLTVDPVRALNISQKADLWFLVWRYRRQVDDGQLIAEANKIVNGAFSLAF